MNKTVENTCKALNISIQLSTPIANNPVNIMLVCAETGALTGDKKPFYRQQKASATHQPSSCASTEHLRIPRNDVLLHIRKRQYTATFGTTIIAENANIAHREKLGAFCWHSRSVDNKTLNYNVLPSYPQVINTLFTRFSTPNRRKRSLVCRATKPVLVCKQGLFASQTRLLCTHRLKKPRKSPLRSVEKGQERAAGGSGLQVGAVKVFYFISLAYCTNHKQHAILGMKR